MKIFSIVTLIFVSHIVHAQLIDTLYKDWGSVAGFFKTDSGSLIVTGDAYLLFLDNDGKVLRTEYIEPVNADLNAVDNVFSAFHSQADSFFYVTTLDNHCDYVDNFRLNKIDWEGNILSSHKLLDWHFSDGSIVFPHMPHLPLFIEHDGEDLIIHYRNDSILVWEFSNYILETAISEEGNMAILTRDSMFYFEMNSGVPALKTSAKYLQQPGNRPSVDFLSDKILMTYEDQMFLLDAGLMVEEIVTFPEGEVVYTTTITSDQLQVISGSYNEWSRYHVYDVSLALQEEYLLEHKSFYAKAFDLTDSILTVAGIEFFPEDKLAAAIYQTDLRDQTGSLHTNIAITNARFIHSNANDSECYYQPVRNHYVFGITIELENLGERTINEIAITSERTYCKFFCWDVSPLFYHELSDVNLLPGEKREFFIESALVQAYRNDDEIKCLLAVFPDMRVDIDHVDNSFCLDVTTGLENRYEGHPVVFPNPVTDLLYIKSDHVIKRTTIIHINGAKLLEQYHGDEGINVTNLLPGMYFLTIELMNGNQLYSRFIKN